MDSWESSSVSSLGSESTSYEDISDYEPDSEISSLGENDDTSEIDDDGTTRSAVCDPEDAFLFPRPSFEEGSADQHVPGIGFKIWPRYSKNFAQLDSDLLLFADSVHEDDSVIEADSADRHIPNGDWAIRSIDSNDSAKTGVQPTAKPQHTEVPPARPRSALPSAFVNPRDKLSPPPRPGTRAPEKPPQM